MTEMRRVTRIWWVLIASPNTASGTSVELGSAPMSPLEDRFPVSRRLVGQYAEFASLYGSRYLLNGSYFNRGTDDDPPLQLLSGDRVETIDLRAHSVRTLFASPGLISAGVERPATPKPLDKMAFAEMPKPSLVARTEDRLLLVSMSGAPLGSYIIPSEFRRETFTFYELVGGEGLALVSRYGLRRQASDLYWFDREGRITHQAQVTNSTSTSIFVYPGLGGWVRAAICPVPIVAAISVPGPEAGEYFDSGEAASMPQAIAQRLPTLGRCWSWYWHSLVSWRGWWCVGSGNTPSRTRFPGRSSSSSSACQGWWPTWSIAAGPRAPVSCVPQDRASRSRVVRGLRHGIPPARAQGN